MNQGGFAMEIPAPELYYQLLPAHYVTIHGQRGVKIRGLWYNGPALEPYRDGLSARGGRHKGRWVIRRDPRDARTVFFQDPNTHAWHTLRWTGLPPEGEVPSFNDSRVKDLLAAAKQAGLKPRADAELLPLLLELIGAHIPVADWPTMPKASRTEHARDVAQAQTASADRASARPVKSATEQAPSQKHKARTTHARTSVRSTAKKSKDRIPTWPERAQTIENAVDGDRRHRREQALTEHPISTPARLGGHLPPRQPVPAAR